MKDELREKYQKLCSIIKSIGKVCVAYSGGVDSALLLKVCRDTLPDKKQLLAVTAVSATYTASEKDKASHLARLMDTKHIFLETSETDDASFTENNPERCYYCKKNFYKELVNVAHVYGFAVICDGSNIDDLSDYRPGKRAAEEYGIRSPLREAGFSKEDIRALSRELGLTEWDRPANPCLASRIPYGNTITIKKLSAIEQSEEFLHSLGFKTVRVRHHGEMASIEVPRNEIPRLMEDLLRGRIVEKLKEQGFSWICADLEGYRMGSMNEVLHCKENKSTQI